MMLPNELLMVWKRKGTIRPRYLSDMTIAGEIIQVFTQYQGKKYKEILRQLEGMEGDDFKLVRGLGTLLERRCRFQSGSELQGKEVRFFLFDKGFVKTLEERNHLLEEASLHFRVPEEKVEEAMFSDLEEEQILVEFTAPTPEELVRWYNLSLTQTLLFDALELTFKVDGNYQQVFRHVKYLGLMYEINEGIRVTGPASLFKKNRKYGTSLAKLLPVIMNAKRWWVQAKIETEVGGEPRILDFSLDSTNNVFLPTSVDSIVHFDSEVEAQFYRDFTALSLGWELVREPDIVKAGHYVVIPDFGFYKNGLQHYLEVVGFWTPEYLRKKIAKLKEAEANITVAVNETLECKKEDFTGDVIFYKNKIPVMSIVKILREIEEKQIEKELCSLKEISLSGDVVSIPETARELHVSPATLTRMEIPGYHVIGEQFVSQVFLEKVREELRPFQEYPQVEEILNGHQLPMQALDSMGYRIIWDGLYPTKVVEKKRDTKSV